MYTYATVHTRSSMEVDQSDRDVCQDGRILLLVSSSQKEYSSPSQDPGSRKQGPLGAHCRRGCQRDLILVIASP